jgi:winged helix domain-containing protein
MSARYGLPAKDAPLLPAKLLTLTKRAAFILEELLAAGADGITAIDYPGVRVSDAILKLRKAGVDVQTLHEQHGGEFRGHHGRYILRSKVQRFSPPARIDSAHAGVPT